MESKKVNLWLGIILAMGLAVAMVPGITGWPMHQGIGIALGVGVVAHHLLHGKWIVAVLKSLTKLPGTARFKLALNILSLLAFSLTIVSGLMNAAILSDNASAEAAIQRRTCHSEEMGPSRGRLAGNCDLRSDAGMRGSIGT